MQIFYPNIFGNDTERVNNANQNLKPISTNSVFSDKTSRQTALNNYLHDIRI